MTIDLGVNLGHFVHLASSFLLLTEYFKWDNTSYFCSYSIVVKNSFHVRYQFFPWLSGFYWVLLFQWQHECDISIRLIIQWWTKWQNSHFYTLLIKVSFSEHRPNVSDHWTSFLRSLLMDTLINRMVYITIDIIHGHLITKSNYKVSYKKGMVPSSSVSFKILSVANLESCNRMVHQSLGIRPYCEH